MSLHFQKVKFMIKDVTREVGAGTEGRHPKVGESGEEEKEEKCVDSRGNGNPKRNPGRRWSKADGRDSRPRWGRRGAAEARGRVDTGAEFLTES